MEQNSSEVERLVGTPAQYTINGKIVQVESLPMGAVSIIFEKILARVKTLDGFDAAPDKIDYMGMIINTTNAVDSEIIGLMLMSREKWAQKKGKFVKADYPVTADDLVWNTTEEQLSEILEEWQKRNPRHERQKKMLNIKMVAEDPERIQLPPNIRQTRTL